MTLSFDQADFIAETERAGIVGVPKGQTEAYSALGLRPGAGLRLVVIPQAMRIIIPPLTSQFLNLTKNSAARCSTSPGRRSSSWSSSWSSISASAS